MPSVVCSYDVLCYLFVVFYVVLMLWLSSFFFFFLKTEDGIRDLVRSRGLGNVYKRQAHVYVRPFRVSGQTGQPSLGEGKWQVSKDHGNWPEWRVGSEIVFNTAPSGTATFAAPVNTGATAFESGVPQQLLLPPTNDVVSTPQASPDGQRFLVDVTAGQRGSRTSLSVVLNWPALLKR